MHIPSGEGICTCVVQYFSMVLYNDFLGQIVAIGLLNSCVSVSTCITCPYTHIRYIAQIPSGEGICTVQLRCYVRYLDVHDSESVYFLSINSCSARAKLYVYFVRVHAISKMCFCTVRAQLAVEILNRAGRGAHFIHSEKCTCTDSSTDSSRAPYLRSTS